MAIGTEHLTKAEHRAHKSHQVLGDAVKTLAKSHDPDLSGAVGALELGFREICEALLHACDQLHELINFTERLESHIEVLEEKVIQLEHHNESE